MMLEGRREGERVSEARLAILYEHSEWFKPLFAELDRRGLAYDRLPAAEFGFDPKVRHPRYRLVVNRMSPSAYLRGHGNGIFFVREFLRHLEEIGVDVINGLRAYETETSKARQLAILERLGLHYPRARVINHPNEAVAAAKGLVKVVAKVGTGRDQHVNSMKGDQISDNTPHSTGNHGS